MEQPITHVVYGTTVLPVTEIETLDEIISSIKAFYPFTMKDGVSFLKEDTILFVKPAESEHKYTIYQEGMELQV